MQSALGRPALLFLVAASLVGYSACAGVEPILEIADARNIKTGWTIPDEGYCDQPYVVVTDDGQWLCAMTTGKGTASRSSALIASIVPESPADGSAWSALWRAPGRRSLQQRNHQGECQDHCLSLDLLPDRPGFGLQSQSCFSTDGRS